MKRILFLVALVSTTLVSCHDMFMKKERGSGNVVSVVREASGYNSIHIYSAVSVYVKQDSVRSVRVVTDDNLQHFVQVRVEGNVLTIGLQDNTRISSSAGIKIYVSSPEIRNLSASGACRYYTEDRITSADNVVINLSGASTAKIDLKAPKVTSDLTGASTLHLIGETRDLDLDGSGSSTFDCSNMMTENVSVDVTGASHADVFASLKLHASASGASSVRYKGNATVSQSTSGASSIKKVD